MPARENGKTATKALSPRQLQIVETGLRIMATKGSRRFTADFLAGEVGLSGGALYRHFPGMDGVIDAIVTRVGEILFEGFPPQADDPIERLRLFFFRRVNAICENPDISQLLLSDHLAQAGGSAQAKRLDEFKQRSQAFVVDCLRQARVAGLSAHGMSAEAGAVMVVGAILALSHANPRVIGKVRSQRLFDEVWAGIERMIRCEPNLTHPRVRRKSQRRS